MDLLALELIKWIGYKPMQDNIQFFENTHEWREWLQTNGKSENVVWLIFFKKKTGKSGISYAEALDEALCLGWIDSLIKKLDEERYIRKFTPRLDGSRWSEVNKKHVNRLIKEGRMKSEGLAKVKAAKKSGQWEKSDRSKQPLTLPSSLQVVLDRCPEAKAHFDRLPPSHRRNYIGWILSAKKTETQLRRMDEAIRNLKKGKSLGLK